MYKITEELLYQCIPIADERIYQAQKKAMPQAYRVSETFDRRMRSKLKKANHPRLHFSLMKAGGKVATVVLAVLLAGMTITMTVPHARVRFF